MLVIKIICTYSIEWGEMPDIHTVSSSDYVHYNKTGKASLHRMSTCIIMYTVIQCNTTTYLYSTLAISSSVLLATISSLLWYLSLTYSTLLIPDWMISLAHSLQGNNPTYRVQPLTSAEFLLRIAFSSAWQTIA